MPLPIQQPAAHSAMGASPWAHDRFWSWRACSPARAFALCAFAICVFALCAWAQSALAQTEIADVGSFSIRQQGQRAGREQFSLRQLVSAEGTLLELRAESVNGDRRVNVQLTTDSAGSPVRYSMEIRQGTQVLVRAGGERVRGRFTTQILRTGGESVREYLLVPGIIVWEAEFYHQLAFVLRGRPAQVGLPLEIPALSLLENTQRTLHLVLEKLDDSITIAGNPYTALRWRLEDGSGVVRTIWGDSAGRVLRVTVPSQAIEVTRDAFPR